MKITFCTPVYGGLDFEHVDAVRAAIDHLRDQLGLDTDVLRLYGCSLLSLSRCMLAEAALEGKADVLLWADGDILFSPSDAAQLVQHCLDDLDIVGAVCSTKRANGTVNCEFPADTRFVNFFEGGGLYEVSRLGFGLTAIRSRVFTRLRCKLGQVLGAAGERVHPYFAEQIRDGIWYGEDYSFCMRAQDLGFRLWVDTRLRTWHKGHYGFRVEDVGVHVPLIRSLTLDTHSKTIVINNVEPQAQRSAGHA